MDALLNLPSYILALLLLLVAVLAISVMVFFQRWKVSRESQEQDANNPWSREQDLRQYGITEIRPIAPRQQTYEYEYPTSFESPEYANVDQENEQPVFDEDAYTYADANTEPPFEPDTLAYVQPSPVNEMPPEQPIRREPPTVETVITPDESDPQEVLLSSSAEDLGEEGIVGVREISPSTEERLVNVKETADRSRSLDSILRPAVKFAQASLGCQTVCTLAFRDEAFVVTSGTSETDKLQQHNRVLRHQSFIRYVDYAQPITILPADVYQLKSDELGYYRGEVMFAEVAAAPIYADGQFWGFLVADSPETSAFSNSRAQRILTDSARLLGESLSEHSAERNAEEKGTQSAPPRSDTEFTDEPDVEVSLSQKPGESSQDESAGQLQAMEADTTPDDENNADESSLVRLESVRKENSDRDLESTPSPAEPISTGREPETKRVKLRREVIYDELLQAREDQSPLAFLLVCLNDQAHEFIPEGTELSDVEAHLKHIIDSSLDGKSRAERFGKLMMGVFLFAPLPAAETWMETIQERITTELNIPPTVISIGATFAGSRHKDGQSVLNEAIGALKDVYAAGGATIFV